MLAASFWLPMDISAHGSRIDNLITVIHWFMAILFVGWGAYFVYCLFRFRHRSGLAASYESIKAKPSKYAEIVVIIIEAVLLIGISAPVWAEYRNNPPAPARNPLEVRVVAQQFAWNIHYPGPDGKFGRTLPTLVDETTNPIGLDTEGDAAAADDVVSINMFHIPKDRDILVRLMSKDVIHSFSVPLLRVKQDAIPGMEIPIWFKALQTNDEVRQALNKTVRLPDDEADLPRFMQRQGRKVAMASYGPADSPIVKQGDVVTEDVVKALMQAGISEIEMSPADPVNIHCAQLCGLGHYRMLGQMQIYEPVDFEAWYVSAGEEEEFFDEEEFEN